MAVREAPALEAEAAPDVRGPTAPLPATILGLGIASLVVITLGIVFTQTNYALSDRVMTRYCIDQEISPKDNGGIGVCNIIEALQDPVTTGTVYAGIVLGAIALVLGSSTYRRMDSKRKRDQAITGAILGSQGILLAAFVLWFRAVSPGLFAKHFLNFADLQGYGGAFLRGIRNTLVLAFAGELGGIVIGLILGVLTLSKRRVVRAPARIYINFFRGTPLIWQLFTGYFMLLFGFGLRISAFAIAIIVFALNTGAYAAEVFRAGIQSIERGQMEAARSLGMSYFQAMRYAIVPQAVRRVIPPLMNEFVILIKDTALVLVLGLTESQYDILTAAREGQAATFNASFFTAAALAYLVITLPLIGLVNAAERRLRSGLVGIAGAGA
ncbi:MAG TPA: amino acid ABC transporter permease [Actinomycetota bacterium]|jgi:polar amino acid transport system permease protein|nr:amino acid ABC transporter permease [Actinomycetota bacterium]